MDNKEEKTEYKIDKLDVNSIDEIENEGSIEERMNILIKSAITSTQNKRKKKDDCVKYRKTFPLS